MEVKERILTIAGELFRDFGAKRVTMDDIATELGMSKKTIYQYYKDKNALVYEATKVVLERQERELQQIEEEAEGAMDLALRTTTYFRKEFGNVNQAILDDFRKYYPETWELYLSYKKNCFIGSITENIQKGQEEGVFRKDVDINLISKLRIHLVELGFNKDTFPLEDKPLHYIQDQLFEVFLRGIATAKGLEIIEQYTEKINN
ncbi:TetR/AcrR family transcriptional regulator [Sediminitomix flava]|uniref:TetR/AcrR family transcriptional regulator n=1 Tax=Sediminitomix flava TaxID=379075 RepID=UPI0013049AF6|nr:TetR/AcrR family transcriptional regulator [Sediminitomix flava]